MALDIDGTLLNPGVHATAVPDAPMTEAVHNLHDAGIVVALALIPEKTGLRVASTAEASGARPWTGQ